MIDARSSRFASSQCRARARSAGRATISAGIAVCLVCVGAIAPVRAETQANSAGKTEGGEQEAYYQYLLGKLQRFRGDLGGAASHFSQAALADGAVPIRLELAETYLRMGQYDRAVEQAKLATERDPSDSNARRTLVDAYIALSQSGNDREAAAGAAVAEMRRILLVSPGDAELRGMLGRLLMQIGRPEEALQEFRTARDSGGDPTSLGLMIARALISIGSKEEARRELEALVMAAPRQAEAFAMLGNLAEDRDDWAAAAGAYQRLAALRPSDVDVRVQLGYALLKAERADEAVVALRDAAAADPANERAHAILVRALRTAGRYSEALKEIEGLLEYHPSDPALLVQMGRLREEREENEAALDAYRRAVTAAQAAPETGEDGFDQNARAALGLTTAGLEIATGDPRGALRRLETMIDDDSDLGVEVRILRVRALIAAGDGPQAVAEALAFKEREPDEPRGPLLLLAARLAPGPGEKAAGSKPPTVSAAKVSEALAEFGESGRALPERIAAADQLRRAGATQAALAMMSRCVEQQPHDAGVLFAYGATLGLTGADRKAETVMERVIEIDPSDSRALNYLGYSLAERGKDLDRAEMLVRKALAIEPRSGAYLDSLGWVLYRRGKADEAIDALSRAADMIAGDATVREHLGDAYALRGDTARALVEWKAAQSGKPEDPERLRRKISGAARSSTR